MSNAELSPEARMMARHLGAITRAVRIHDAGNRAVSRLIGWAARDLSILYRENNEARVEIDAVGVLVVNGTPLRLRRETRTQLLPLSQMMREAGFGGFRLTGEVSSEALLALFWMLQHAGKGSDRAASQKTLESLGGTCFQLLAPRILVAGAGGGPGAAVRLAAAETLQAYIRAILAVQQARDEDTLLRIPPQVYRAAQGLADLADGDLRMHMALTSLKEDLDYDTRHPVHSMIFAMALGARVGLPRTLLVELGLAALAASTLPDVAGADEILAMTLNILASSRLSLARARRMLAVFEHRAGVDRTGPPYVPLESPPHLFGRICAIAVTFDQLTTSGTDRAGLLPDEALARMAEEATVRFDGELLRLFAGVVGRYPLGSAVELDDGSVAVVVHTPSDAASAARPLVRVVRDERGVAVTHGALLDLGDPACVRRITGAVDASSLGIDPRRALFG